VLAEIYIKVPDGGTHAAAGWALRQWQQELPTIAPTSWPLSNRHWFVNGQGMTMVEVAAGKFTMFTMNAAGEEPPDGAKPAHDAKPGHEVTFNQPFYLADREVTVEQFQRFIDEDDYPDAEKPQGWHEEFQRTNQSYPATLICPVTSVNWFDAVFYCNWLSTREGRRPCYERTGTKQNFKNYDNTEAEYDVWRCQFHADGYRLPTEAEWEFSSRAGSTADFCFGSGTTRLLDYAWFLNNADSHIHPGAGKLPNAWGLFDMHGNAWEWCWDWTGTYDAEAVAVSMGLGARWGRVLRGGAFVGHPSYCRSGSHYADNPVWRNWFSSFRVLCGNAVDSPVHLE
jgi:formylglycine-generating enzyme required for sulfatase activity